MPPPAHVAELPQAALRAAIPRLRRYARVLTGDAARADALVQDTLGLAWDRRAQRQRFAHADSDLRTWLFAIMHDVYVRQSVIAPREAQRASVDAEAECASTREIAEPTPSRARIPLRTFERQLGLLPADQREILLLAVVEALRYEAIAGTLGIPLGTVVSRLARARDSLRRMAAGEAPPALNGVETLWKTAVAS
jgi:RNA polymerase sigma-70 factor (ECF subfamily)